MRFGNFWSDRTSESNALGHCVVNVCVHRCFFCQLSCRMSDWGLFTVDKYTRVFVSTYYNTIFVMILNLIGMNESIEDTIYFYSKSWKKRKERLEVKK